MFLFVFYPKVAHPLVSVLEIYTSFLFNFQVSFKVDYLGEYNPKPPYHFCYGMRHFPKEKLADVHLKIAYVLSSP